MGSRGWIHDTGPEFGRDGGRVSDFMGLGSWGSGRAMI